MPDERQRVRVLLVGAFRSMVSEGDDGPFGGQGGFVDTLAPEPYSLANGYLKAFVEADPEASARCEVELLNLSEPLSIEDEGEEVTLDDSHIAVILEREPDVVAFSTYAWNLDACQWAAAQLRRRHPEVVILFGGKGTDDAEGLLRDSPSIDAAITGEGELPFREILRRRAEDHSDIPGVVYRDASGEIRSGGPPVFVQDIDTLPSPYLGGILKPRINGLMMELARGCIHSCAYCSWNAEKTLRLYGPERIEAEIRWALEQGHRHATIVDSAINYDTKGLIDTVDAIRRADPDGLMRFSYNIRHEDVDEEQLAALARLHTHVILFGVETLAPRGMANLRRAPAKVPALERALDGIARAVRPPVVSIMLGLPGDTEETFLNTLDTLIAWTRPRADGPPLVGTVLVSLLQIYRGSGMWKERERLGLRVQETGIPYLIESPSWSVDALARMKAELVRRMAVEGDGLKAAEAIVLMEAYGGISPWLTNRRLTALLADWNVGESRADWTLEKMGLMRDSAKGILVRFRHAGGGGARYLFERRDPPGRPSGLASRCYRVTPQPLPGPRAPEHSRHALEELVVELLCRGEAELAALATETRRRMAAGEGAR